MAEAFGQEIPKLLVSGDTLDVVKQSAALCLLRLFRTDASVIPSGEKYFILSIFEQYECETPSYMSSCHRTTSYMSTLLCPDI